MKITMSKREILKCCRVMRHCIDPKTTIPALRNIRITAEPGRLELWGTDLDTIVRFSCDDHAVEGRGAAMVPWSCLKSLNDAVSFISLESGDLAVLQDRRSFTLKPGCLPDDFPVFPETQQAINPFMLDLWACERVRAFGSSRGRGVQPEALRHVALDSLDGTIKLILTDGTMMTVLDTGLKTEPFTTLLPYRLFELAHDLQHGFTIYRPIDDHQFYRIEDPEFTLWFRPPTEQPYPLWRRVIPESFKFSTIVTAEAVRDIRAALIEVLECRRVPEPPAIRVQTSGPTIQLQQIARAGIKETVTIPNTEQLQELDAWVQPPCCRTFFTAVTGPVELLWNRQPSIMALRGVESNVWFYMMPGSPDPDLEDRVFVDEPNEVDNPFESED